MKVKVSEASGVVLDWMVAKCEGLIDARRVVVDFKYRSGHDPVRWEPVLEVYYSSAYAPSTDWAQGGPIIEGERISVRYRVGVNFTADIDGKYEQTVPYHQRGKAHLLVAMRCYVASKLGDEVDVPDELKEE